MKYNTNIKNAKVSLILVALLSNATLSFAASNNEIITNEIGNINQSLIGEDIKNSYSKTKIRANSRIKANTKVVSNTSVIAKVTAKPKTNMRVRTNTRTANSTNLTAKITTKSRIKARVRTNNTKSIK